MQLGSLHRGSVQSGNCPVGEVSIGEGSVGDLSLGEVSVGELPSRETVLQSKYQHVRDGKHSLIFISFRVCSGSVFQAKTEPEWNVCLMLYVWFSLKTIGKSCIKIYLMVWNCLSKLSQRSTWRIFWKNWQYVCRQISDSFCLLFPPTILGCYINS